MSFLAIPAKQAALDPFKYLAIFTVLFVSKLFKLNGLRACRFHPSCSQYSLQAFERFDLFKAVKLTGCRLLRCQPFDPGGYDPLPDTDKKFGS